MSILDLRRQADVAQKGSFSNRMRSRRFSKFEGLLEGLPRPLKVIDIGGTVRFWEQRGWTDRDDVDITLVNLHAEQSAYPHIRGVAGDATKLKAFGDRQFDIAFSNSVIEHLFTLENQLAMAREVQRVARAYWVQTPNYWFPMEPHFHVPGWQWLPQSARVRLLQRRRCGWRGPCPDETEATELVREVRLMTRAELRRCFPDATLWPERLGGLVKSWVAYGGFARIGEAPGSDDGLNP